MDGLVTLRKQTGEPINVLLDRLSKDDQEFARDYASDSFMIGQAAGVSDGDTITVVDTE